MEGSIQTEQLLLEELYLLRARVAKLEEDLAQQRSGYLPSQCEQGKTEAMVRPQQSSETPSTAQTEGHLSTTQELLARIQQQEAIFEALADSVAVYDQQGYILRTNLAFRQLLGLNEDAAYTTLSLQERAQVLTLRDEYKRSLPPERWPLQRVLKGETLTNETRSDTIITTPDGRELQVSASGSPLRDEQKQIIGAVIIFRDVTERRKAERRSIYTLRALLVMAEILVQDSGYTQARESMTNPITTRLARLTRRLLNCTRVGISLIEPTSKRLLPLAIAGVSIDDAERWRTFYTDLSLSDVFTKEEMITDLYLSKPLEIEEALKVSPFGKRYGLILPMCTGPQLIGLLSLDYGDRKHIFTQDELAIAETVSRLIALVMERERLHRERAASRANELALLEANRRMDEFLSIASHELRTPLTTINGNIQLAKRRLKSFGTMDEALPADLSSKIELIQELLNRAERQVRVQNRLVGDLLDVSRIQANRLELHMTPRDLLAIVREAVEDQRSAVPTRMISMELPAEESVPILSDGDRIGQVVVNYITNALKYSEADRPVTVRIERSSQAEGDFVRVSVRDEGPGLPLEEQERVWQRFYRVPGITVQSGSGVGLGLGLHICRTIVERHNGSVGVESTPGMGSTFWFTLPVAEQEA